MGHQRRHSKLTSSEFEEGVTGECTIEILQEDKLQIVNQKQKFVKQSSLRFGLFDFSEDMAWEEFLDKVAEACKATQEGMVISSLCWKWMKPANSSLVPLCNVAGFKSLKKKLTGHQPMIILMMRPPKAPDSEKLVCSLLFASTCSANVFGTSETWEIEAPTGEPNRWASSPTLVGPVLPNDCCSPKKVCPGLSVYGFIDLVHTKT